MSALVRSIAAVSLIVTMFAAVSMTGAAQTVSNPSTFPGSLTYGANSCYFAAVYNGHDAGLGAAQTHVVVQNLSDTEGVVYLKTGTGNGYTNAQFAVLQPGASKSFSAASLGISAGNAAPVAVGGYTFATAADKTFSAGIQIGCVAKAAVSGANLPATSSADKAVTGYNATSGQEVGFFDDLYLPIVQTNCGPGGCWNTKLQVANVGPFSNAAVTVRLFPADDGSGSLDTGMQVQNYLSQGELWTIDLSTLVPSGWVGSAHVYSDDSVVAIAERYKVGTNMWLTNTASNAPAESDLQVAGGPSNMPYVLYAPDVRLDYNAWNTGISVANIAATDNTVNIQYFGNNGNAPQAQTQRLSAHGMTYFYNPSSPSEDACAQPAQQVVTCDFVGGAIILSQQPVAAAIDGVKYFGNDAAVGQAFTYNATGNVFEVQAAPLIQKGSASTGMGATSGITFLNVNAGGTYVTTTWLNPSGFVGSNFGPSVVWIPGYATGFVYTMTQRNLPNGFTGSAVVVSDLPIAATSANVDYAVTGDGTAIYNLYNPCGLYRQLSDCAMPPVEIPDATKNFSVRPASADAWICIVAAVDGQDNPITDAKGDFAGGPCVPNWVFGKGLGEGGQGQADNFVANTVYELEDEEGGVGDVVPNVFLSAKLNFSNNTSSAYLHINGEWEAVDADNHWFWIWEPDDVEGSTLNTVCADLDGSQSGPNHDLIQIDGGTISGVDMATLKDNPENAILVVEVDGAFYCGQLEGGSIALQTPAQLAGSIGGKVVVTDQNGNASIALAPGCYDISVSAEGYVTQGVRECFEAGEVYDNNFDLVALGDLTVTANTLDGVVLFAVHAAAANDTGAVCNGELVATALVGDADGTTLSLAPGEYCVVSDGVAQQVTLTAGGAATVDFGN